MPRTSSLTTLPAATQGLLWVALAGLLFVAFVSIVRYVSNELHPVQAAFIRYALGLVVLLPVFAQRGLGLFRSRHIGWHAMRGTVHAVGVMLWFFAVTQLPLAEVTALSFASPIYVVLGAAMFLRERLTAQRIIAVSLGFAGVLIILRPGFQAVGLGAVAMIVAAPLFAASKLLTKALVADDSSTTVVAYLSIFATISMLIPALWVWQTPSWNDLFWLTGTAVFATLSHLCMARGLMLVDVSAAQPVEFLQLVWSTLIGLFLFAEQPSLWVWMGAAVIVASASYIARYENAARRLNRKT